MRAEAASPMQSKTTGGDSRRHTTIVLSIIIAATVALFVVTHFLNATYQRERASLARQWLAAGDASMAKGASDDAVDAYRASMSYDAANPDITLRLAGALVRSGREEQASSYLRTLLETEPGNGPVNLALARLAAHRRQTQDALRYYHRAIYGAWAENGQQMRLQARFELVDFLLSQKANADARSELISLTGDLPRDPALTAEVADRLLRAGDDENALRLYRQTIALHGATAAALTGAGTAAFHLGDYRQSAEYLQRARAAGDAGVTPMLATARAVLELDPFATGLSGNRQLERMRRLIDVGAARAASCKPQASPIAIAPAAGAIVQQVDAMQQLAAARRTLDRARDADPDLMDAAMKLLMQAEATADRGQCPAPSPQDSALALIARAHEAQP